MIGTGELCRKIVAITVSVADRSRGRRGLAALEQTLNSVEAGIAWREPILKGETEEQEIRALLESVVERARAVG